MSRPSTQTGPVTFEGLDELAEDLLSESGAPMTDPPPDFSEDDQDASISKVLSSYDDMGGALIEADPTGEDPSSLHPGFDVPTPVPSMELGMTEDLEEPLGMTSPHTSDEPTTSNPAIAIPSTSDLVVPEPANGSGEGEAWPPPVDRNEVEKAMAVAGSRRLEIAPRVGPPEPEAPSAPSWLGAAVLGAVGFLFLVWMLAR